MVLMLPHRERRLWLLGAVIAAGAFGAVMLALANVGAESETTTRPGVVFYVLAFLGVGSAVRVITHPHPVYAALYFILTIIAMAGLLLLLAAEFMAFAVIIVYAGAILITYLFVIMLAQEAPVSDGVTALADYDVSAREPVAAVVAGFVLLALLGSMTQHGLDQMPAVSPRVNAMGEDTALIQMTNKAEQVLLAGDLITDDEFVESLGVTASGQVDALVRTAGDSGESRIVSVPDGFVVDNIERVGISLFEEFPVSLEVAGVILMLAMFGAVILSRRLPLHDETVKGAAS